MNQKVGFENSIGNLQPLERRWDALDQSICYFIVEQLKFCIHILWRLVILITTLSFGFPGPMLLQIYVKNICNDLYKKNWGLSHTGSAFHESGYLLHSGLLGLMDWGRATWKVTESIKTNLSTSFRFSQGAKIMIQFFITQSLVDIWRHMVKRQTLHPTNLNQYSFFITEYLQLLSIVTFFLTLVLLKKIALCFFFDTS